MKKLFLIASITLVFAFLLLIPSFASDTDGFPAYDRTYNVDGVEYPIWEQDANGNYHPLIWYLNNENKMCKVWADNQDTTKAPYVTYACYMTSANDSEIGTVRIYDENGTEYLTREKAVIANFNGVQITYDGKTAYICRINQNAFNKSALIRAAFLPKTINLMGPTNADQYKYSAFRECANLEYVEFPENADITTIGNAAFYKCYSLKAISLPKNVKVLEPVAFQHCTSLQAVYLPEGFQKMVCNSATSGPFHNCTSMYFVNEPFVLNSTLSNIPEKKSVYYFPSTLTGMGEGIRDCANMNETLVIPNYTSHTTSTYEGTGVKTVVYLGDMTYFWMTATQSTKLNIVFANTTSTPKIEVTGDHSAGSTIYACSLGKSYSLNDRAWKDETVHFEEISKAIVTPSTSCTEPSKKTTFCYCGKLISEVVIEEALGHDFDVANGAIDLGILYADGFFKSGVHSYDCARCDVIENAPVKPIFYWVGYSAKTFGDLKGFGQQYVINQKELGNYKAYVESQGDIFSYGVVAAGSSSAGQPLSVAGNEVVNKEGAQSICFDQLTYDAFFMNISGIDAGSLDVALMCCAYVRVGDEIVYLDNNQTVDTVELTSFAKIDAIVNPKEDIA